MTYGLDHLFDLYSYVAEFIYGLYQKLLKRILTFLSNIVDQANDIPVADSTPRRTLLYEEYVKDDSPKLEPTKPSNKLYYLGFGLFLLIVGGTFIYILRPIWCC